MKRKNTIQIKFFFALILLTIAFTACDDFFEVDISKEHIALVVPVNGIETDIVSQVFRWEELDGASSYRLMIVTPDFKNAGALILDTLIATNYFEKTLTPGSFEWRVRGENDAFKTGWSSGVFTIFSTDDLTHQSIRLLSPSVNYFTNKTTQTLKWDDLYNADSYEIRAYKNEWNGELLIDSKTTTNSSVELTLPENEIIWGVKAVNDISETQFTTRRLVVDITPPGKPTLKLPSDNAELSNVRVDFSWESNDVTWTDVTDSLFIFYDSDLSEVAETKSVNTKSVIIDLTTGKDYYWCVKSIDKAGNQSAYSSVYRFSIGM